MARKNSPINRQRRDVVALAFFTIHLGWSSVSSDAT